ncbi:MAG TPA: hypothetical protein EYP32_04035, partial [Aquificaceae bacterium]|nr:hypothetical protein [Aquificaceae bacterium]
MVIFIFLYDLFYHLIPVKIVSFTMALILIFNVLGSRFPVHFYYWQIGLKDLLWGVSIGFLFFFLQYFFSKGRWVGEGDIFLGVFFGVMFGIKGLLLTLFLAYLLGAFLSLILII